MHYVKQFHINGVDTKQVACIELHGKPNAATEGAVGVLGIDMDSPLHDVYKCVGVNGSIYSWELLSSGLSIMSATISGGGTESVQFPYANLLTPAMYVVKIGDLILDSEGYLYQIKALNTTYCDGGYCGTQIAAYGKSAYDLAVKNGFEGSEEEWIASLKGERGDQGIQGVRGEPGHTPYIGENGNWWIAGIDTGIRANMGMQMESGWYNGTGTGAAGSPELIFSFVPKIFILFRNIYNKSTSNGEFTINRGLDAYIFDRGRAMRYYTSALGTPTTITTEVPTTLISNASNTMLAGTTISIKNMSNMDYNKKSMTTNPYSIVYATSEDDGVGYWYVALG